MGWRREAGAEKRDAGRETRDASPGDPVRQAAVVFRGRSSVRSFAGTAFLILLAIAGALTGCSGSSAAKAPTATATGTAAQAEQQLKQVVLQQADVGTGFTQDVARVLTNDDAAQARPDTQQALRQYAEWHQVLAYNVGYSAPPTPGLVFNAKTARITNSATLFGDADGAAAALAYARDLPSQTVADFLINDGAGTKISDTQVVKDLDFPAVGDESFAWRVSGKATFSNGYSVNFVADAVFVRVGHIDGSVLATALGAAPERDQLEAFVAKFVRNARAHQ
jgi:hypothetical protein